LNFTEFNLQTKHGWHLELLNVIGLVWCIEHFRYIVSVALLSDTGVDSNKAFGIRINFERHLEFKVRSNLCFDRVFVQGNLQVKVFDLVLAILAVTLPFIVCLIKLLSGSRSSNQTLLSIIKGSIHRIV